MSGILKIKIICSIVVLIIVFVVVYFWDKITTGELSTLLVSCITALVTISYVILVSKQTDIMKQSMDEQTRHFKIQKMALVICTIPDVNILKNNITQKNTLYFNVNINKIGDELAFHVVVFAQIEWDDGMVMGEERSIHTWTIDVFNEKLLNLGNVCTDMGLHTNSDIITVSAVCYYYSPAISQWYCSRSRLNEPASSFKGGERVISLSTLVLSDFTEISTDDVILELEKIKEKDQCARLDSLLSKIGGK